MREEKSTTNPDPECDGGTKHGSAESRILIGFALVGLLAPNGLFLYGAISAPGLVPEVLANPISLALLLEAVMLTALFAWLLQRRRCRRPGALLFTILSLLGSLAFSIPVLLLLLAMRRTDPSPD